MVLHLLINLPVLSLQAVDPQDCDDVIQGLDIVVVPGSEVGTVPTIMQQWTLLRFRKYLPSKWYSKNYLWIDYYVVTALSLMFCQLKREVFEARSRNTRQRYLMCVITIYSLLSRLSKLVIKLWSATKLPRQLFCWADLLPVHCCLAACSAAHGPTTGLTCITSIHLVHAIEFNIYSKYWGQLLLYFMSCEPKWMLL
jgi:hypothetical protein